MDKVVVSVTIGNYPNKIPVRAQPFPGSVPLTDNGIMLGHVSPMEVEEAHRWIRQNKQTNNKDVSPYAKFKPHTVEPDEKK